MIEQHLSKILSIVGIVTGLTISIYLDWGIVFNIIFAALGGSLMGVLSVYFIKKGYTIKLISAFVFLIYYTISFFILYIISMVISEDNDTIATISSLILSLPVAFFFMKREMKKYLRRINNEV